MVIKLFILLCRGTLKLINYCFSTPLNSNLLDLNYNEIIEMWLQFHFLKGHHKSCTVADWQGAGWENWIDYKVDKLVWTTVWIIGCVFDDSRGLTLHRNIVFAYLKPGLMKDHGQQARVSENFAGPVDFETPRPDLPVHF